MTPAGEHHERDNTSDRTSDSCDPWRRVSHRGRSSAPGLRRHSRLITASPALTAAEAGANHTCLRQKPSYFPPDVCEGSPAQLLFAGAQRSRVHAASLSRPFVISTCRFQQALSSGTAFDKTVKLQLGRTTLCQKHSLTSSRLIPASTAEPAAAEQQQHNDNYEKCGGIHGLAPCKCKNPGQVVLLSEALRFYKVPGPGSSGGEGATVQLSR